MQTIYAKSDDEWVRSFLNRLQYMNDNDPLKYKIRKSVKWLVNKNRFKKRVQEEDYK